MTPQHYNSQDLEVRTAVAACAIGCLGSNLAKASRYGSLGYCDMKNFEIAVEQMNIIRTFELIELPSSSTITILADGATDVASTITVNSVTISDAVLFTTDATETATLIAAAINNLSSTPDFTATSTGARVTITSVLKDSSSNGDAVAIVGGDFTASLPFMNGGQTGVDAVDNIITEDQLEHMFNNIAELTGCCYAPLGYAYEVAPSTAKVRIPFTWNVGSDIDLNAGGPLELN